MFGKAEIRKQKQEVLFGEFSIQEFSAINYFFLEWRNYSVAICTYVHQTKKAAPTDTALSIPIFHLELWFHQHHLISTTDDHFGVG
jgi:hypothetical protein